MSQNCKCRSQFEINNQIIRVNDLVAIPATPLDSSFDPVIHVEISNACKRFIARNKHLHSVYGISTVKNLSKCRNEHHNISLALELFAK